MLDPALPFQVDHADISRLDDIHLVRLLGQLVRSEAARAGLPAQGASVPLRITVADGGVDGRVEWSGAPAATSWFPRSPTVFQAKAGYLGPTGCGRELCVSGRSELKPEVAAALDDKGAYILFYGLECNTKLQRRRLATMRQTLKEAGRADWETADLKIYDATAIARWTNEHLAAVNCVLDWIGKGSRWGEPWAGWSQHRDVHSTTFVADAQRSELLTTLRAAVDAPRAAARLVGLSGLGKSRLAFEAFRPEDTDATQAGLSARVVYVPSASAAPTLAADLARLRAQGVSAILVVDDCDLQTHRSLAREVSADGSLLSLLTLDFEVAVATSGIEVHELGPLDDQAMDELLAQRSDLPRSGDRDRIRDFAQGYPLMAVLLADALVQGEQALARVTDDQLFAKLLWGRGGAQPTEERAAEAAAVLPHFGVYGQRATEGQFLAQAVACIDERDFYAACEHLRRRGILEQRGDYLRMRPLPLALWLAARWWTRNPAGAAAELLVDCVERGLGERLCRRLSKLHHEATVRQFLDELIGPPGPLSEASVVGQERGARLLRWLAEAVPEAVCQAIDAVLGAMTLVELEATSNPRREWVWTLEKLCFWPSTFPVAAGLLLRLAAAESERGVGGNATGQFQQLFHLRLSGTQAEPQARLAVLDRGLRSGEPRLRAVCVDALGAALTYHHFSRTGGVEHQGGRAPAEDWAPTLWSDIQGYWRDVLERLRPIAASSDPLAEAAREGFVAALLALFQTGLQDEAAAFVDEVLLHTGSYWAEATAQLRHIQLRFSDDLPEDRLPSLNSMLGRVGPHSVEDRVDYFVRRKNYGIEREQGGGFRNVNEEVAIELLEQIAADPVHLEGTLRRLSDGPTHLAWTWGRHLAEMGREPREDLALLASALADAAEREPNPGILGGYLAFLGRQEQRAEIVHEFLAKAATEPALNQHMAYLVSTLPPTAEQLSLVADGVEAGRLAANEVRHFSTGSRLDHLSGEVVSTFLRRVGAVGAAEAAAAFDVGFMYAWDSGERWEGIAGALADLLEHGNLLSTPAALLHTDTHNLDTAIPKLLASPNCRPELAERLAQQVLDACVDFQHALRHDRLLNSTIASLLQDQLQSAWPILGRALLDTGWSGRFALLNSMKGSSLGSHRENAVAPAPDSFLLQWCRDEADAAGVVAALIPLRSHAADGSPWHPLALALLDEFGRDERVLRGISATLHSFGFVGSAVPEYEGMLALASELIGHRVPEVDAWARREVADAKRSIDAARKQEEEWELDF